MIFNKLPAFFKKLQFREESLASKRNIYLGMAILDLIFIFIFVLHGVSRTQGLIRPLVAPISPLQPLKQAKSQKEVFGFAPFWTFDKLSNIDFNVLTTLAYFGVDVDGTGNLDRDGQGYQTFKSSEATVLFKKAHVFGTRVVLTLTQMNNNQILALLDDPNAQASAIDQTVNEVKKRGIDGVNVDFEYGGDPGQDYRDKFSQFVANLMSKMHQEVPSSYVTVSVYAASVKEPKIYDISALSKSADGIFMMAYDFAAAGSDNAIPTAPLYGYKSGKYWYDVSTAVDDFLAYMPANKLILGVPWYGYNYTVYGPQVKAATLPSWSWGGQSKSQTYGSVENNITPNRDDITNYQTGWDEDGQVGYVAYYVPSTGIWRMVFFDDPKSLTLKYDFAKSRGLRGVGMWALGFEEGRGEMWQALAGSFGQKQSDGTVYAKEITDGEN